jgi:hypothetical protein
MGLEGATGEDLVAEFVEEEEVVICVFSFLPVPPVDIE